ncbi:ComF family protein [Parabacteroides distasonis]|uniref:ComF family protein n=1 Tax=Parabacteroides distasonis TaxID=823 RepID=A0A3L7ZU45_PARDI|nr:ComF family protein [Parabacteroides distasonis]NBH89360.1 ComF family protein [Parabacteroides distasonis]RLT74811.1 ComF family protein [Parabacteroides distasonis]
MPTIWNNLLNLFFPNLCKICKRPLVEGEEQICLKCLCDLPHTGYHQQANNPVEQLFIGKNRIEYATAYLRYEKGGKVQSLIHSLKYHDNKELGYLLGRQIARELQADHSPICTVDLLIPVPLHPRKKRQRGYNQSEWIASGIRSVWDIPIDTQSLARTTHTNTQTHKAIYDRWLNVCSIFNVIYPESLKNKHILLIDDVITTGATISACAKALSGIPGIRISILALSIA